MLDTFARIGPKTLLYDNNNIHNYWEEMLKSVCGFIIVIVIVIVIVSWV